MGTRETTMSDVVTRNPLEATDLAIRYPDRTERREQMCDLLRAHGIDPHDTLAVEFDVIDLPLLRVDRIVRDDSDRIVVIHGNEIARTQFEVPLRTPLPAWWQPTAASAAGDDKERP